MALAQRCAGKRAAKPTAKTCSLGSQWNRAERSAQSSFAAGSKLVALGARANRRADCPADWSSRRRSSSARALSLSPFHFHFHFRSRSHFHSHCLCLPPGWRLAGRMCCGDHDRWTFSRSLAAKPKAATPLVASRSNWTRLRKPLGGQLIVGRSRTSRSICGPSLSVAFCRARIYKRPLLWHDWIIQQADGGEL